MVAIGIILIVAAVFLTIAVLMQHGKSHNLSGTIAGASETFFGKSKASTIDKKLSILTTVVAIVFVVLVLVAYLVQDMGTGNAVTETGSGVSTTTASTTTSSTTTAGGTTTEKKEEPTSETTTAGESADPDESGSDTTAASSDAE